MSTELVHLIATEDCPGPGGSWRRPESSRTWAWWAIGVAVAVGVLQSYLFRYSLNPDGLSYIDIAEGIRRGDLRGAINAYWSPLYPCLLAAWFAILRPSPAYEFQVVHLANFLIYVSAILGFRYFLAQLYRGSRARAEDSRTVADEWLWQLFGFSVFTYTSVAVISTALVTPDLLLAAIVYWVCGVVIGIRCDANRGQSVSSIRSILLGLLLGAAYWAKAAAFLFAPVFLACAFAGTGRATRNLGLAVLSYAMVCGALVLPTSIGKGRLTFGDSGRLNYIWNVNKCGKGTANHWFERDWNSPRNGVPRHPTRRVDEELPLFEFASPIDGTYPLMKDPSYWNDGLSPYFSARQQIRILLTNLAVTVDFSQVAMALIAGLCIIALAPGLRGEFLRNLTRLSYLIIPSIWPFLMYWLVHIEGRFVGSFLAILIVCLFASLREKASLKATRILPNFVLVSSVVLIGALCLYPVLKTKALNDLQGRGDHVHLKVAEQLRGRGVLRGDRIACIGTSFNNYWAHLAGVQIVADIPGDLAEGFWNGEPDQLKKAVSRLRGLGVRASNRTRLAKRLHRS